MGYVQTRFGVSKYSNFILSTLFYVYASLLFYFVILWLFIGVIYLSRILLCRCRLSMDIDTPNLPNPLKKISLEI
uniref:Putative ovule protein n=1 Tax=Solanum chacoense TaxID=4108 RepID=A0A0V0IRC4_SOLCH